MDGRPDEQHTVTGQAVSIYTMCLEKNCAKLPTYLVLISLTQSLTRSLLGK